MALPILTSGFRAAMPAATWPICKPGTLSNWGITSAERSTQSSATAASWMYKDALLPAAQYNGHHSLMQMKSAPHSD